MKTINLFKKEYPELDLKLMWDVNNNTLYFSGRHTPAELIGRGTIIEDTIGNVGIKISSVDCPELRIELIVDTSILTLFIGGREHNDMEFIKSKRLLGVDKQFLQTLFKMNLNKQITIL